LNHKTLRFSDLDLHNQLLQNVDRLGYETATPIQAMAIPPVLEGRDVLASAPTGTGKTAAFVLPMLQKFGRSSDQPRQGNRVIRGLVLCPTRELAIQIADSLRDYGRGTGVRHVLLFGGVNQFRQVKDLRSGVDVVIATPGRLMDLMGQGHVNLSNVEMFVLDEADRMLDMGFIPDVRRIAEKVRRDRQTLLFSATIPPTIAKLVKELMDSPVRVEVKQKEATVDTVDQSVLFVKKMDKPDLLAHVVDRYGIDCGIVFSRTKHGADRVVKQLDQRGIPAVAIHGNKSQNQRQRALDGFKRGRVPILVATDVAARGIDVDGITHVINYDLTHEPETYVHRIGRTGRAGASGIAFSFCDGEERAYLRDIQKLLGREIDVMSDHPFADGRQSERTTRPRGPSGRKQPEVVVTEDGPTGRPKPKHRGRHPLASARPKKPNRAAASGKNAKPSRKARKVAKAGR
jgi:ATP-dependent RNA helicase RhlE